MTRLAAVVGFAAWGLVGACNPPAPSPGQGSAEFTGNIVVQACGLYVSCVADALPSTAANCAYIIQHDIAEAPPSYTYANEHQVRAVAECVAAGKRGDCATVMKCATRDHGPDYCAAHPGASCDGNLAIHCRSTTQWADPGIIDCAAHGAPCVNGACTNGDRCDTPVFAVERCSSDDQYWEFCDTTTQTYWGESCALLAPGGSCSASQGCVPKGGPPAHCDPLMSHCEGNTLVYCDGERSARIDCGTYASHCGTYTPRGDAQDCVPDGNECTQSSPDRCNGNTLELCVGGKYQPFDCTALGRSCKSINGLSPRCLE